MSVQLHPASSAAAPTPRGRGAPLDPEPRPDPALLTYYALTSLLFGPFFWAYLIPMFFRFRSLRYRFDEEGVTMSWGILFRKEISLTYARIQDIHLTSNVIERWLGLARIQVQTASGNASAEMTIEGLREFERIRNLLYSRMRGAREVTPTHLAPTRAAAGEAVPTVAAPDLAELTETLRAVAREVRALREEIAPARGRTDG